MSLHLLLMVRPIIWDTALQKQTIYFYKAVPKYYFIILKSKIEKYSQFLKTKCRHSVLNLKIVLLLVYKSIKFTNKCKFIIEIALNFHLLFVNLRYSKVFISF